MKEEKDRDEYVVNESGLIYAGTYDNMFTWPWNFAQVQTCMHHTVSKLYIVCSDRQCVYITSWFSLIFIKYEFTNQIDTSGVPQAQ